MYDAIVVGARCAGSATAMQLARKGHRVLLVDKAAFPSDTLSTHYIHQPGIASMARWGILDRLQATGVPPIEQQVFDVGPFALRGTPPPIDGIETAYAPRRTVLDKILVDAAVEAGAELRENFAVKELMTDGDRVTGVRGRSAGGVLVDEPARFVVGADGMRSPVAHAVGAPSYNEQPAYSCAYYTYWSGVPMQTVELYPRPGRMLIAAPTSDDLTITISYWPTAEFHDVRGDIEKHFMDALDLVPSLSERVRAGERVEKFRGSADLANFFRKPFGPGWALVGDAGYHKNPITAEGITDAFRDADLLVDALDEILGGDVADDKPLAAYEMKRNEAAMPIYELTCDLAKLEPPSDDLQNIMGAIRGNQEQMDRFIGVIAGTVAVADFFSPENIAAIFAAAG